MSTGSHSEAQIIAALKQLEAGWEAADVARVSDTSLTGPVLEAWGRTPAP